MPSARMPLLDTAPIPGGGELRLFRDGAHFTIKIAGHGGDLMSTRMHGSEDALAHIGCAPIASRAGARVLVGGLGMGFTLAAALHDLRDDAEVTVAELVPGVVAWNRGELGEHAGRPLDDPRTRVVEGDVGRLVRTSTRAWDAILLDVDNGPEGLTRRDNDAIYSVAGLAAAHAALRDGGVLAVWSAHADAAFTARLGQAGFAVDEVPVRAHAGRGSRHRVWVATRANAKTAASTTPPRRR